MSSKSVSVTVAGIDFTVDGDYSPYRPATMYKSNGDPGDPAEGGDLENATIMIGDVDVTEVLSPAVFSAVIEAAEIECSNDTGPEPEED